MTNDKEGNERDIGIHQLKAAGTTVTQSTISNELLSVPTPHAIFLC